MEQTPTTKTLRSAGVQAATGATRGELREWETKGLIKPKLEQHFSRMYRVYDDDQIDAIRQVRFLKAKGLTPVGIARALPELQAWERRTGKQIKVEDLNTGDSAAETENVPICRGNPQPSSSAATPSDKPVPID